MTSFVESHMRIRCDVCAEAYPGRSSDVKILRMEARVKGWTAGRAIRAATKPRVFDACEEHRVPAGYRRI